MDLISTSLTRRNITNTSPAIDADSFSECPELLNPDHPSYKSHITLLRNHFSSHGALVIPHFIKPAFVHKLVNEAMGLSHSLYNNCERSDVFLKPPITAKGQGIHSIVREARIGVIANDCIPETSLLRGIYNHPHLTQLITDIVNQGPIYHYKCPLGQINYQLMSAGSKVDWHYDAVDFVVSIPLQKASSGGEFEYIPDLRLKDDADFSLTQSVLRGEQNHRQVLSANPGSLILLRGHNTLHRVTEIDGWQPRINCLLGYSFHEEQRAGPVIQKLRYGRTLLL